MSRENVEIVRRAFAAFQRGDLTGMLAPLADDAITHRVEPDNATFSGKEGFLQATAEWTEGFERWTATPEEFFDAGAQILVRVHQSARGERSGIPIEADTWFLFTMRDGEIARVTFYAREDQALEAAGLPAQGAFTTLLRPPRGQWDTRKAMPEENVEIVRHIYADWARGDMKAGVDRFDPEIAFTSFMPDSNALVELTGPTEVDAFMRDFLTQWRDYRLIGEQFRPVGDKVFVGGRQAARGRYSGVEVEVPFFSVWTLRRGMVTRLYFTPFRVKALEAAGLAE